jgi:hypothetical protein
MLAAGEKTDIDPAIRFKQFSSEDEMAEARSRDVTRLPLMNIE